VHTGVQRRECSRPPGRARGGQVLVAESYGGRDEPVDTLVNNLVAVNVVPVFDALRVKATPTEGTYQARPRLLATVVKEA